MAYLVTSDEGHGSRREINLLTITAAPARFFTQHFEEGKDVEWVWTSSPEGTVDTNGYNIVTQRGAD